MKLSIIVPVHNVENYLPEAIESVIRQTYKDWELILVENASCDRSYEICLAYAEKFPGIRVCVEKRADLAAARNRGMKEAGGEYLMFLDSDDYLASDTVVDKLMRKIEEERVDAVVCNYSRLWNGKLLPAVSHEGYSYKDRESEDFRFEGFFSCGNMSYVWGKIYRASFLKEQHIAFKDFEYAEDKMFNTECYAKGIRYAFIKENGYIYIEKIRHRFRTVTMQESGNAGLESHMNWRKYYGEPEWEDMKIWSVILYSLPLFLTLRWNMKNMDNH